MENIRIFKATTFAFALTSVVFAMLWLWSVSPYPCFHTATSFTTIDTLYVTDTAFVPVKSHTPAPAFITANTAKADSIIQGSDSARAIYITHCSEQVVLSRLFLSG
jgi:hypothetical protein